MSNSRKSVVEFVYATTCVQCEHLFALIGISLKHSGHFLVVGSAGGPFRDREISRFIGFTTKKKIVAETSKKEIMVLTKCPYMNLPPFRVKKRPEKSGTLAMAEMNGVSRSETREVTTVPNAAPTTTPTAKSTTFPRSKNCLNSFSIF